MASYLIIDTIRTACPLTDWTLPGSVERTHVSSVVLDRGGAYLVTDVYDFMDHGHTFFAARPFGRAVEAVTDPPAEPVSRMRCRHCGRPTLRLASEPSTASEAGLPAPRTARRPGRRSASADQPSPASVAPAPTPVVATVGRRRRGDHRDQYVDNVSTE